MSRLPGQFQEPRIIVLLQKYYKQSKTGRELLEKENLKHSEQEKIHIWLSQNQDLQK